MSVSVPNNRPGPLREWPIDRFLPSNPNILTKAGSSRPNKRTLSPDGPSLFSPTKRRILNEEGIFVPEKTMKSPLRGRIAIPAHFGDLLGPDSPAKKLDFGTPKPSMDTSRRESNTSCVASSSGGLLRSPELRPKPVAKSTPPRGADPVDDDFFATPERLASTSRCSTLRLIPRDIPAASDPQSIHYPGFTVHQDAHVVVVEPIDSEISLGEDKEEDKENLVPRRKVKKSITEPTSSDAKLLLLTPEAKKKELEKLFKAKSTPATPKKVASKERQDITSPTPRRPGLRSKLGTPVVTEEERKQRRLILKHEVEVADTMSNGEHF